MHQTGQIYRPPSEASVQRLEVTIGCSHNKCSFCTMYRKTPFRVAPLEDVEMDLKELHDRGEKITRIYLTNGDPFVLGTDRLVKIAELVHQYLPEVEVFTCYASIQNLKAKSLEDLKLLKSVGYDELYVGLETAYAPAVKLINKGFTVEEAYENIGKLKEAGMKYSALLMLGIGGKGHSKESVEATAALLNKYSLDGNLYANGVHRINVSPMAETHDKAVLLVMMFVVAGCLASPELAIETTRSFMKKKTPLTFSTLQPTMMDPNTLLGHPDKQTKLGLIRISNDTVCSSIYPLSTSKEGTTIGLLATGKQNINDVDVDVSRKHLRIFRDGDAWYAQGLGSTNGTILISGADKSIRVIEPPKSTNEKLPPVEIDNGDTLCLGKTTQFLVLKIAK